MFFFFTQPLALAHLYRPRAGSAGFAIPVFRDDKGALLAQEAGPNGLVTGFVPCIAAESRLFPPPFRPVEANTQQQPWMVGVGMPLLYAFQRTDGSFVV